MSKLTFKNYSRHVRTTREYDIFAFCVFLEGDKHLIDSIDMIEYVLHPTFPDPVREISEPKNCFALQSEAWGTFDIDIRVFFKDGRIEEVVYPLKLKENDWPKGPKPRSFQSDIERQVYEFLLLEPKWQWRKITTIANRTNQPEREANRALESLSMKGEVRKANFRSVDNRELWGATSIVGLLPLPRDHGKMQL